MAPRTAVVESKYWSDCQGFTPDEVLRALSRDGWVIGREGAHSILEHATKPGNVVVPRHRRTLKLGTLNNILKAAGLTREEFKRLL